MALAALWTAPAAAVQAGGSTAAPSLPAGVLEALALSAGYVAPARTLDDDGEIVGYGAEGDIEERSLTVFDVVHVTPAIDGGPAAVGDSLLLYRDAGDLRHPESDAVLGRIVVPTGVAVVTSLEGDVASAVVVDAFAPVVAGQGAQRLVRRLETALPAGERAPGAGMVLGVRPRSAIVEPYAVVFLDLPAGGALAPGDDVALVRSVVEDGRRLPEVEIGAARVVDVGPDAATAIVTRLGRSDLEVGDRYRRLEPAP
ncbi:MAG TPA: hypothetical protein VIC56_09155 [Gemmatimonadota bacterium]|jgi:hypothetical protein